MKSLLHLLVLALVASPLFAADNTTTVFVSDTTTVSIGVSSSANTASISTSTSTAETATTTVVSSATTTVINTQTNNAIPTGATVFGFPVGNFSNYNATGIGSGAGELNSSQWRVLGLSSGNTSFGQSLSSQNGSSPAGRGPLGSAGNDSTLVVVPDFVSLPGGLYALPIVGSNNNNNTNGSASNADGGVILLANQTQNNTEFVPIGALDLRVPNNNGLKSDDRIRLNFTFVDVDVGNVSTPWQLWAALSDSPSANFMPLGVAWNTSGQGSNQIILQNVSLLIDPGVFAANLSNTTASGPVVMVFRFLANNTNLVNTTNVASPAGLSRVSAALIRSGAHNGGNSTVVTSTASSTATSTATTTTTTTGGNGGNNGGNNGSNAGTSIPIMGAIYVALLVVSAAFIALV